MKKLITLLCATVTAFSLIACGGSSAPVPSPTPTPTETPTPTPTPTPEPEEPELSPYEQKKQAILEHVDIAYTGLTPAKAPMYFMSDSEGEYVALVLENADGKSYIRFVGSAVFDEESGITTVTDSDKNYSFGFIALQQANGSFFLDCGNLGEAYMKEDKPEDVVDYILTTFQTMEDVTDNFMDAVAKMDFMDSLELAYTGVTAAGAPMFFLASYDGSFAALVLLNANGEEYVSFVGNATVGEDDLITVIDSDKGYSFSFYAEVQDDGSFFLDCGDLGECYLEPDDVENVVEYIDTVFIELNNVTDAFMETFGH